MSQPRALIGAANRTINQSAIDTEKTVICFCPVDFATVSNPETAKGDFRANMLKLFILIAFIRQYQLQARIQIMWRHLANENVWNVAGVLLLRFSASDLHEPEADDFQGLTSSFLSTNTSFGQILTKIQSVVFT